MSIKSFADYLSLEKKYSVLTVNAYKKDIESFLEFLMSQHDTNNLDKVNYSQIRSWIVQMVDNGLANRSINRKVSSLNSYYKFLLRIGNIQINPLSKHKALKTRKKVQVPFSETEIVDVLDSFYDDKDFESIRDKLVIELFYSTGIRRIELVNLKLSNIDLTNKTLKVLSKRNKERIVPLIKPVQDTLRNYLNLRTELDEIHHHDALFLTKKGSKIYETLVYRIINNYFSKASSKVKKSPHILRHSFATHILNQGADINAVKELLGHSSLAATQIYTHNSIAELKKVHINAHPRSKK
ncbi:tyrosine-type recombinase/integrase [Seonamhaeicola sp. ML3]|uniref:tyrosine-type recombinase/integrase n=1 Tax=Seonamhaeicola sp. ML3 TaxID=2937786 RepID=UPI00201068F5|nr:tyrosine-type recombinase/integrase [Seonamhaeicola sp. ML3]